MLWRCQRSLMCYITNKALPISSFHTAAFPKIISSEKSLNLTQCSAEPERNCYSRILPKVNDFHNIKDIIKAMLRKGFHPNPNTLEMILSCFCKVGRMREAYQVLCLMISLGLSVSVSIWSNLIHGSFLLCEPEKAIYLLKKMLESGWLPDVVTYTTLVKGFMDSQMVSQAFDVLQSMESRGLFPDLVLCNLLIGMYTKIGRYDDALEIFAKFPELGLEPDPHTFSSLLANICSSRRFSLFPMIADGVALEADLVVCNALLNYFCKAGFPSHAVKLYNDMIDKGLAVDNHSFVGLLNGLCRMGHVNEAIKVYQGLTRIKLGLDAHVHTIIASELIKAGELDKAISLFRKAIAERHVLDHVSYVVVIQGLLRSGRNREAYSLHKEMKRVGIVPNSQDYDVIITGCCRVRDVVVLGELLKDISAEQIELDVSTLVRVRETLCNTHPHPTVYREFCKIWNSRSMSSQMFDTTASDVNSCDFISVARYRDNPPDSSCSADHYEMAVSAC